MANSIYKKYFSPELRHYIGENTLRLHLLFQEIRKSYVDEVDAYVHIHVQFEPDLTS